jgi:hypothetical protein
MFINQEVIKSNNSTHAANELVPVRKWIGIEYFRNVSLLQVFVEVADTIKEKLTEV